MVSDGLVTFIAFIVDFIATASNQASFAIQKLAHKDEEKKKQTTSSDKTIEKSVFCSWKGLCGMILVAVGGVGHFVALPFCDLTLIACNASSAVLMNVYISHRFLGEKFVAKYDLTAVTSVTLGTLVIILVSNKEQQVLTADKIVSLCLSPGSLIYFAVTAAGMLSLRFWMPLLLQ